MQPSMRKRWFDIIASIAGLILCSPLLVAIAIWVKLDSPGPVFYRGRRAGLRGRPFGIYKFRSMVVDADATGGPSTSDDDPRITSSGRFIRRFKLDELSQLLNVLLGDMSLVGPRPEVVDKVQRYTPEDRKVLELQPGITDWASIWNADEGALLAGTADPDAAYEKILRPTKLRLQRYYCEHRNFFIDLKLIVYTVVKVVKKDWVPSELSKYPTFADLRVEVEKFIAEEKQTQAVAESRQQERVG